MVPESRGDESADTAGSRVGAGAEARLCPVASRAPPAALTGTDLAVLVRQTIDHELSFVRSMR